MAGRLLKLFLVWFIPDAPRYIRAQMGNADDELIHIQFQENALVNMRREINKQPADVLLINVGACEISVLEKMIAIERINLPHAVIFFCRSRGFAENMARYYTQKLAGIDCRIDHIELDYQLVEDEVLTPLEKLLMRERTLLGLTDPVSTD